MAELLGDLWLALWVFLPVGAATGMPVLVAQIPGLRRWQTPLDGGRMFRGQRLLGSNKTWRGLVAGILASTTTLWLQQLLMTQGDWSVITQVVDYAQLPTLIVGPLFGLGAIGGDAVESFFKRQRGLGPGEGWFPWDQIDHIIGGALLTAPFVHLLPHHYVWVLVIWLGVHIGFSYLGYLAHWKERPI